MLMMPPMKTPTLRTVLVRFTEKPVCAKSVLKKMPTDSPHEVIQKALKKTIKKSFAVRGRPTASTLSTLKRRDVMSSNGTSFVR